MPLQLHDLSLDGLDLQADGKPMMLPIDAIDEDPNQPRVEFDAESLQELALTIAERGVRQPVSVRTHPDSPGRWQLNFGARRLRASRLAGKQEIPAFVDETADHYDQVIENEQRDRLTALEMALFVQRRMNAGDSQAEIARRLGKSRQHVMRATALVDAPDWLMDLYRSGRCTGFNELYELRRIHEKKPDLLSTWLAERGPISRDDLSALRRELEDVKAARSATPSPSPGEQSAIGSARPHSRTGEANAQVQEVMGQPEREWAERAKTVHAAAALAYERLMRLAEGGQSRHAKTVAYFLVSCFDGRAFPFDLFVLRSLDVATGDDMLTCIDSLRWSRTDLHSLISDGRSRIFAICETWTMTPPDPE